MLSRLSLRAGTFSKAVQQRSISTTPVALTMQGWAGHQTTIEQHVKNWDKAHDIYFGPERDLKNFPLESAPETRPAVRLGFIPETMFNFLYDKTGVTGPYLLATAGIISLLSKEIWVFDHQLTEFVPFWVVFAVLGTKLAPVVKEKFLDIKITDLQKKFWDDRVAVSKIKFNHILNSGESLITQQEGQKHLFEAKRENVDLQLEATYRKRMAEVHTAVKKRLDYVVAKEQTQRKFQQDHMVNWIVESAVKGITPQQEKDAMTKCISDLKGLAVAV